MPSFGLGLDWHNLNLYEEENMQNIVVTNIDKKKCIPSDYVELKQYKENPSQNID